MFSQIATIDDYDRAVSTMDWADAYVKDVRCISPTSTDRQSLWSSFPHAPPSCSVVILQPDAEFPGVAFLFEEIRRIHISFDTPLAPLVSIHDGHITFRFHSHSPPIESTRLFVRQLTWDDLDHSKVAPVPIQFMRGRLVVPE